LHKPTSRKPHGERRRKKSFILEILVSGPPTEKKKNEGGSNEGKEVREGLPTKSYDAGEVLYPLLANIRS